MTKERLVICIDSEEVYFNQEDQEKIRALREKATKEKEEQYQEDHKYHCFRCGTKSLVEIQKGNVTIDICVNEGCGAVHLDPGELEELLKDPSLIKNAKSSIFNIFK